METITVCYNCKNEIGSEHMFCKSCGSQLKCKKCQNPIVSEVNFCTNCGEKVLSNSQSENRAVNLIDFSQKGNSKFLKANFTDVVGAYFANAFNNVMTGQSIPNKNIFQRQLTSGKKTEPSSTNGKDKFENITEAQIIDTDYAEIIAKIFRQGDNGNLEVIDNRLKEKSKSDKIKRLSVLFVYAKKLMGTEATREEVNNVISRQKLSMDVFRKFLSKDSGKYFSLSDNGGYTLLAGGEDFAKEILEQIGNPGFVPSVTKAGRKFGKKSPNDKTSERKSNTNSNEVSALEMTKRLINEGFFSHKKKLIDITTFCSQKKAMNYSTQLMQLAVSRLVKDGALEREKNEGQYEYWKK